MKIVIFCVCAATLGIVLALCRKAASQKKMGRRESREQPASQEPEAQKSETMKRVIWFCLLNGIAWVWCSYGLAYLDKPQIAESLSQVAVTEIIGVVLAYAVKSVVENLSKNNRWPDRGDPPEDGAAG